MISIFKIIGIILCFISCSAIGIYQSSQIKSRKLLLIEFQDFLQQISTEMGYFKEPLQQIFQRIIQNHHNINQFTPVTLLLRQCTSPHSQPNDFYSLWKSAIESAYQDEPLNSADTQIFIKCGAFLGQSDFDSQKGHFSLLQGELEKQIRDAEENIKTKGSLYGKAGVSIGAVIAIALL